MKQTAVEWLKQKWYSDENDITDETFEQAKQMEKEQVYRACAYYFHEHGKLTPTQYCNQIFKSE